MLSPREETGRREGTRLSLIFLSQLTTSKKKTKPSPKPINPIGGTKNSKTKRSQI